MAAEPITAGDSPITPTCLPSPASSFARAKQTIRSSDGQRPQIAQPISGHLVFFVHAHEPPSASRPPVAGPQASTRLQARSMRPDHGQQRPHAPRPRARSGRQHHEATASTPLSICHHQPEPASMPQPMGHEWQSTDEGQPSKQQRNEHRRTQARRNHSPHPARIQQPMCHD
ncbi:hypothetical protein ACLOJK_014975 [Asimina triloba]